MKTLGWNCRGLGNPATVRALQKVVQQEKPEIIFLMETKLDTREIQNLNKQKLRYERCFPVDCERTQKSRRGGLCMIWSDTVELSLISYSMHHISFNFEGNASSGDWFITGLYGWPDRMDRDKTWSLLHNIRRRSDEEWLCMGDFNETMWSTKKRGGIAKTWHSMRKFRDTTNYCGLIDLGYTGSKYTWSNGREGEANIKERLDSALATQSWKTNRPQVVVKHLPRYRSDHNSLLITEEGNGQERKRQGGRRGFRFEHIWLQHPSFPTILKENWRQSHVEKSLDTEIQEWGEGLLRWAKKEFGSVRKKKKELTEQLLEFEQNDHDEIKARQKRVVAGELDKVLQLEETMWH